MKKDTRINQVKNIIFAGLKNLYNSQEDLNFDKFSLTVLESLMLLEREEYLKSESGQSDSGNGSYLRDFRSLRTNSLQISIPRSRNGHFKPLTLNLIKQQNDQINELALLLYRKGLSTRDVSSVMKEFFGESISFSTVSKLASSFHEIRLGWEKRPLDAYYKVIFCDALYVNLKRRNSYSKEAVYVMYGVKDDNTRELILLETNPTESSTVWGEYLKKLNKRGLEQVDLIVADGLMYFVDEVKKCFPGTDFQKCVVHLQRNMLNKVRAKDKEEFGKDLKNIFNNFETVSTKEKCKEKIKLFVEKWREIYKIVSKLKEDDNIENYITYIDYPIDVRRMIDLLQK